MLQGMANGGSRAIALTGEGSKAQRQFDLLARPRNRQQISDVKERFRRSLIAQQVMAIANGGRCP